MGDVVIATRALAALRRAYPTARLVLLAKSHATSLLAGSDLAVEVIACDFPWTATSGKYRPARYDLRALARLVRRLRAERFDLVLDARMDARSNLLTFLSGARRRIGFDYGGGARLLTDRVPVGAEDRHRLDDWAALLARAGVAPALEAPTLRVTPDERVAADALLAAEGIGPDDPVVGIHPGASNLVKRWPLARFAEVADALIERRDVRVIAFAGPDEGADELPSRHPIVRLRPDLRGLMALLARCDVVLCNDSGPMHVAESLGVPVVSVFGPSRPEWFAPRGEAHGIVVQDGYDCRPCFEACVLAEPYCLSTIDWEPVYELVEGRLQGRRTRGDGVEHDADPFLIPARW